MAEKIIEKVLAEPAVETKAEKTPAKPKGRTKADLEAEKIAAAGGGNATVEAATPKAAVEPEGEDLGATFNEDATPEPEIPDTELSSAMNATVGRLNPTNGGTTPKFIKELIQTFKPHDFPANGVFKSAQIPQNMRKQFLMKLKEMK